MTAVTPLIRRTPPRPYWRGQRIDVGDRVAARRRGLSIVGEVRAWGDDWVALGLGNGSVKSVRVSHITHVQRGGL